MQQDKIMITGKVFTMTANSACAVLLLVSACAVHAQSRIEPGFNLFSVDQDQEIGTWGMSTGRSRTADAKTADVRAEVDRGAVCCGSAPAVDRQPRLVRTNGR
jgi:hypothetical protein